MAFNPQELFNKYKQLLTPTVNKLSSVVKQSPISFVQKQFQPQIQQIQQKVQPVTNFIKQNPLPAGYGVKKFQQVTRPIVQKMTTYQAPFEKQAANLPQPIQSAFPITGVPNYVGENIRQAGRLLSLKPNPYDAATILGPMTIGKVAALHQTNKIEPAIQMLRNKITRQDVDVIGEFSTLVETGKGRQEMGELGQTIHSLAKNVFGSQAETWSNQKIKNVFDLVLGKIGQGPNTAGLGLTVKEIRKLPISSAGNISKQVGGEIGGVKKIVKPIKVQTKRVTPEQTGMDVPEFAPLSKSPIPSQETIEKAAKLKLQYKVATGQVPRETPTLPDIIQRDAIDVKEKVNLIDYLRTPDRVLKKIGLEQEGNLLRKKYNDYLEKLPQEINRITQWSKEVPQESNQRIFQYLDGKNIVLDPNEKRVAGEIKTYLQKWADKLKLPQESRITNYITHIFDKDFIKKEFDPEMAKLIENRVAGSVYDPFVEQRLGKMGYKEDTWAALDAYVKRATRKVNLDEALKVIKDKAQNLELSQYKYVKQYVNRINMRPTDLDNLLDNTLKTVFGYKYGLRPTSELTKKSRQAVYRGTLGLNIGSAVKNLTQGANTYARLGEKYTILGYLKNAVKIVSGDDELKRVGVLRDEFIQDRTLNATKKFWEKIDKGLFVFFETAEKINRGSAYFGAKAQGLNRGMTENQAIQYGLKVVRDTQFTFGSIDTPPVLSSDIAKLLLQFQSFTIKQGEFLGEMVTNKDVAGMVRYSLASVLMASTIGKLIGMEWKDFIPSIRIGFPPTLQAPVEIGKAFLGAPDEYGNVPNMTERVEKIGNTLVPFIPGGTQIKKTIQGLETTGKGYSESKTGRIRTPVGQDVGSKVKGALFGQYNLPEMQKYYDENMKVLGEKQSAIFKALSPEERQKYFQSIQENRKKKKQSGLIDQVEASEGGEDDFLIDVAKERIKLSGTPETVGNTYIYKDENSVKTINLDHTVKPLQLTGQTELDKSLISKYKGKITAKKNDIVQLQELGVYSAEEAEKKIKELIEKSSVKTGTKKKKLSLIKLPKISVPKIKTAKVKKITVKPRKTKQYKLNKIKLKKVKLKKLGGGEELPDNQAEGAQEKPAYCGPASLSYVLKKMGKDISQDELAEKLKTGSSGTDNTDIVRVAKDLGYTTTEFDHETPQETLNALKGKTAILDYVMGSDPEDDGHFAVYLDSDDTSVTLWNPWDGKTEKRDKASFINKWKGIGDDTHKGMYKHWALVVS